MGSVMCIRDSSYPPHDPLIPLLPQPTPLFPTYPPPVTSPPQDLAEGLFEPEDLNRRPPDEVAAAEASRAYKAVAIAAPVFKKTKADEMKEKAAARRLKKQEQRKKAGMSATSSDPSRPTSRNKKRGKHDSDTDEGVTDSSAYVDRMRKKQAAEAAGPRQRGLPPPPPSKEIAEARRRFEVERAAENAELARRMKKTKATLTYLQDQVTEPPYPTLLV